MDRQTEKKQLLSLTSVTFDQHLYADHCNYVTSIPVNDDELDNTTGNKNDFASKVASYTAPKSILNELPRLDEDDVIGIRRRPRIVDRENDYRRRRLKRAISPERHDPFAAGGEKTPDPSVRTYADIMRERNEADRGKKEKGIEIEEAKKKRRPWVVDENIDAKKAKVSDSGRVGIGKRSRWDETPISGKSMDSDVTPEGRGDETPDTMVTPRPQRRR